MGTGIYPRTAEHCRNISKSLRGHTVSQETKNKISEKMQGGNSGSFKRGYIGYWKGKKRGYIGYWKGKKLTEEHKEKLRQSNIGKHNGAKNPHWKGGISKTRDRIYSSSAYKKWRKEVFKRDNYICQVCGEVGGRLQAHHLKPFSTHPKLRFDVNNGQTLCLGCHKKTKTYGNFNPDKVELMK